jgi:hypothetical protein
MSKLPDLFSEYVNSLTRCAGETDLQKQIAIKAKIEFDYPPAIFRKTATAMFKDNMDRLRYDTDKQLSLLQAVDSGVYLTRNGDSDGH